MSSSDWKRYPLGDTKYFEVIMGQSPPSSAYNDAGEGLPFYQGKTDFGKIYPTPRMYCTEQSRIAEKDDVLMSVGAPVGPTNLANERCCIGRGLAAIRCKEKVLPRFLLYSLRSIEKDISESVKDQGGGFTAIKKEQLKVFEIPVPSLPEQRRIVARIEELTRRAEEAQKLRQEAMDTINRLFQTELESIFSPIETDDWIENEAREAFDIVKGQVDPREVPYVSMPHVSPDVIEIGTGRLIMNKIKTAEALELKSGKYLFDASHVLYSKIRPNLRKVALPDFEGTCSADMYPLIPNLAVVTREFLALVVLSPSFTEYAVENSDRNAMPKVNRFTMFGYRVKLPELPVQREIVARIRGMQDKAEEISRLQMSVDRDLQGFQAALLAKAFRGEL